MKRKLNLKKTICVLLTVVAVICTAAGCSLFPDEENVTIPVLNTPKPVEYSMFKVARGTVTSGSSGIGSVNSVYYTKASFPNSGGYVSHFNVKLGDTVNAGDIIVELDNNALAIQLEEAEIDYEIEQLSCEEAIAQYGEDSVFTKKAKLELKKKKNTYETLKKTYEETLLRAPVSGVVVYLNTKFSSGNGANLQVSAGETMVAIDTLDTSYMYVTFSKTLEALNNPSMDPPEEFRVGTKLDLSRTKIFDDGTSVTDSFKGTIVSTTSIVEDTGVGYVSESTYYCKMENPPADIATGDIIKYVYTEAVAEDCLYIPISAYYTYDGKTFVYVLDNNNLKVEKYVELGIENSTYVVVLSGLTEGEKIVLG